MVISNIEYFLMFVITYALVGLLTPVMRKIAVTNQILDRTTSSHKSHTQAVPYLGGVAILIGVVAVPYGALLLNSFSINNFWLATSVLAPAIAMGLVGLWDDLKNLPPLPRFIGQSVAGLIVAIGLVISNNVANPTGSTAVDISITVVWIVGICNSINFFDNLDGGAAGTAAISAIFLTYLAINNGQSFIAALAIVVAGATLGFLIWNRTPARIYMGDAGALFLGILLAILTIRLNPDTQTILASFATPILLLAVPILDTCVAVFSRLRRRVSPFQGGKDHLSHRLVRAGLSRKMAAASLWTFSALFGLLAVILTAVDKDLEGYLVVGSFVLWTTLFIGFFKTTDK
jgi:UDP-GlcNAc:undecaprenyl-phosphate GlcNAc-1-phosphate transferase